MNVRNLLYFWVAAGIFMMPAAVQAQRQDDVTTGAVVRYHGIYPKVELNDHLKKIQLDILHRQFDAAVRGLEALKVYLYHEEDRATEKGKELLGVSAMNLDYLEKELGHGNDISQSRIDQMFAQVYQAMAMHHYLKTENLWLSGHDVRAGYELELALERFEGSLNWLGEKRKVYASEMRTRILSLSQSLMENETVDKTELKRYLKVFGDAIETLRVGKDPAQFEIEERMHRMSEEGFEP